MADYPDEALPTAAPATGQTQVGSSTGDDVTPMAIAVETVSANAVTLAILALLASGLTIAGIDRAKRQSTPGADAEAETPADE